MKHFLTYKIHTYTEHDYVLDKRFLKLNFNIDVHTEDGVQVFGEGYTCFLELWDDKKVAKFFCDEARNIRTNIKKVQNMHENCEIVWHNQNDPILEQMNNLHITPNT